MPGERWLQFAGAWFDERTITLVIEPLIADWRQDLALHRTALAGFEPWALNVLALALAGLLRHLAWANGGGWYGTRVH